MVLLALFLLLADSLVNASCECGFYMNDTKDYFTHVIYNNFSALAPSKKLSTNPAFTNDWAVQDWGIPPKGWVKPLGIDNAEDNVFLRNGNLVLRQQGYSKAQALKKSKVSVASIASQRGDIIHGSFRVELKMENANGGSCGAFFWYHVSSYLLTLLSWRFGENEICEVGVNISWAFWVELFWGDRMTRTKLTLKFSRGNSNQIGFQSITQHTLLLTSTDRSLPMPRQWFHFMATICWTCSNDIGLIGPRRSWDSTRTQH